MSSRYEGASPLGDRIEETLIAFFLGVMTLITFANVIARLLNSNILWALEATVFLFAWMVLLGASYAVKHTFHIGVDVVVQLLPKDKRRIVTLVAVAICITFSLLLLKGSWDYWWAFATKRAFYEVNDVPMPSFLQFFAHWLNDGELYEKMPRFIPYVVLPISSLLLTIRFIQAGLRVWRGDQELIIESHDGSDDEDSDSDAANSVRELVDKEGAR
jgi:C4-dicarboxylate transporter DctQ subunit